MTALLLLLLLAAPAEAYNRAEWPWVRGGGCQTTRTRVLIRDAQQVTLDPTQCRVLSGTWLDRYSGQVIDTPAALDIDHLIPLAWVDAHGGAAWSSEQKKAYANFLGFSGALLAVSASANRAKGSKGPAEWRPAHPAAACAYGRDWAVQLVIWDLAPDPPTRAAIRALVGAC